MRRNHGTDVAHHGYRGEVTLMQRARVDHDPVAARCPKDPGISAVQGHRTRIGRPDKSDPVRQCAQHSGRRVGDMTHHDSDRTELLALAALLALATLARLAWRRAPMFGLPSRLRSLRSLRCSVQTERALPATTRIGFWRSLAAQSRTNRRLPP